MDCSSVHLDRIAAATVDRICGFSSNFYQTENRMIFEIQRKEINNFITVFRNKTGSIKFIRDV